MITVGSQLGQYEMVAQLGAGGMGEVWRAHDRRLRRDVAIKVLPEALAKSESALARFEREARSVAALSHPNILAIHDFAMDDGVVYAVMELLEGATLRDLLEQSSLSLIRALEWAHQITQGLAAAHERGIIHRDLKPENIFVTRDGIVKILDFGLARLDDRASLAGWDEKTSAKTVPGTILGTIGYLSPEQARGETTDHRSDLFAFGAVFFEMLTGQQAFVRASPAETIAALLREEPRPLAEYGIVAGAEVEEILRHCLEKHRDQRFRSARDLAFALRLAIRAAEGPAVEPASRQTPRSADSVRTGDLSIAVLPFRNIGASAEAEYFSDGMTEEIISSISSIAPLRVAARTSSFAFKGRDDDIRRIGRELGVRMIVEGSVRLAGSRLRVSAQLINIETGYQVWSLRWDRELADVFAVQDEIAQAIAATFKLQHVPSETAGGGKTQNVEAYDRYLKARFLLNARRSDEAIYELEAAVAADPDFGDAYTALADSWAIRGFYGGVPTWEAWARGSAAVDEAERIARESEGILLSRGILEHYYGWNTAREERFLRDAIERNPRSAEGWNWLSLCYACSGRTEESIAAAHRAIELEPYNVNAHAFSAWPLIVEGDFEAADRILSKATELDPGAGLALWSSGITLRFLGKLPESIAIFERLVETSHRRVSWYVALLGGALAAAGERAKSEELLEDLRRRRAQHEFIPSIDLSIILSALGDDDAALDALERAYEERNALLWYRIYLPDHLRLRSHPRWKALARRLGRTAPVRAFP